MHHIKITLRLRLRLQLLQEEQEDAVALAQLLRQRGVRRQRRGRRLWVRPWIQRRELFGNYDNLMMELARESQGDFTNYMRMEPMMFRELLDRIGPRVQKETTHLRDPLPAGMKLAITLRYIASGDSYHSLCYSFRVPHNTISLIVKEVSEAIVAELEPEVFNFPTSQQQWLDVAEKSMEFPSYVWRY